MGVLGGVFLVSVLLMAMMFCGFYFIADEVKNRIKGKLGSKTKEEHMELLVVALRREGFFNVSAQPMVIQNKVLSEVISDATKAEGFFWNICKLGISVADNPDPRAYDHLLIYQNNVIGFNWRG